MKIGIWALLLALTGCATGTHLRTEEGQGPGGAHANAVIQTRLTKLNSFDSRTGLSGIAVLEK